MQWGLKPQTSNHHNTGPEVDIDVVPMAFLIICRGLKGDVVHQVAYVRLQKCHVPLNFKPPFLELQTQDFALKSTSR